MPKRFVREPAGHDVTDHALAPAPAALLIRLQHPALQHRPIRFQFLPNCFQAELIEAAERGQVRGGEGSVVHVEVFRMGCVRTSIIGRPRRSSRH